MNHHYLPPGDFSSTATNPLPALFPTVYTRSFCTHTAFCTFTIHTYLLHTGLFYTCVLMHSCKLLYAFVLVLHCLITTATYHTPPNITCYSPYQPHLPTTCSRHTAPFLLPATTLRSPSSADEIEMQAPPARFSFSPYCTLRLLLHILWSCHSCTFT